MRANGNETLKSVFHEKVEELFSDEKFVASEAWYIDTKNELDVFKAWYEAQNFKPTDVNAAIVATTLEYSEFEEFARKGLSYVLKTNAPNEPNPISENNLISGWSALFGGVLSELVNGSQDTTSLEILVSQALFSKLDINPFLNGIPDIKKAIESFVTSKKSELDQKVGDLGEAVNSGALALNEDVSALVKDQEAKIAELTSEYSKLQEATGELMTRYNDLVAEKESWSEPSPEQTALKEELDKKEIEVTGLKEVIAEKQAELESLKNELENNSASGEVPEEVTHEIEALNEALKNLQSEIETKDIKIAELQESINTGEEEVQELRRKAAEFDKVPGTFDEAEKLQERVKELEELETKLNSEKEELEAKLTSEKEELVSKLTSEKEELEAKLNSLQETSSNSEELKKNNQELQEKISQITKELEEVKNAAVSSEEIDTLTQERDDAIKALEEAKIELAGVEGMKDEKDSLQKENEVLKQQLEQVKKDVVNKDELLSKVDGDHNTNELLDKISKQSKKLADCQAIISEMKSNEKSPARKNGINIVSTLFGQSEDDSLKKEIEILKGELEVKNNQIAELTSGNDIVSSLEAENSDLKDKLAESQAKIKELTEKIGQVEI